MSDPIQLGTVERTRPRGESTEPESTELRVATAAAESAARVEGVHQLGGAVARGLDRASRRVLGTSTRPGVTVSTPDGVLTVDIDLVIEYPHPVRAVLDAVREQVQRVAEPVAGGHVVVNVAATDVLGPFDPVESEEDEAEPLIDTARRAAADARDSASEAVASARYRVSGTVASARGTLADAADDAADALDRAADERVERAADREEEREHDGVDEAEDGGPRRSVPVPAAVETTEFVVRVKVEPVDQEADPRTTSVEIAPAEDAGDSNAAADSQEGDLDDADARADRPAPAPASGRE
ncbi:Asp23/Gls24 family envelope stress response protein [Rathayibacter tanaceti]|uniref:Asp23/Gls24 family envelope stress response protein n=2 Tax=Rathayibacter tanaceti TaxID=1671680 RepID=A0A162GF82_9MICO|nr:Asp23/Gls24 family envelope stress response protein [Rathayibacter tanaceti]KZX20219.1 hypothetical protein ACH61_02672 [Rathayibacter tanaceti]QHC56798.1 Asp23/Gls24 family envelope stress response protein [Rathayibacter tanaceti]TCO33775.1 putative alkaline shock family protein YloU [Rathayibacter tanaceti]